VPTESRTLILAINVLAGKGRKRWAGVFD